MSLKPPASLSPPRISVIVPVFNGAPYLAETLESIRRQTLPVAEVIVVDDGSTDESTEIAARHSFVTLVRKEHSGINATLNRGLEEVTGNLIAFLDQDDRWLPQKSLLQVTALRKNPALDFVFGHVRRFRSAPPGATEGESTIDILRGVSKQCMMIKKPSFDQVGFFSNEGRYDFLDWYSRALEAGLQGEILPEVVAERRIHAANFGVQNPEEQRRGYLSTLKATLDRQRAAKVAASGPATSLERTA
jgi:glycosyltransferase involved in cell wall biosynthesis